MGDTSSGKSSLLSALSGVSFPSSDQLTTRCPTQLVLSRADTFRGSVRLVRFQSVSTGGDNSSDDGEEKETCSDWKMCPTPSPDSPRSSWTKANLPGLVRTVGDHEDQSIIPRVRQMVDRYMQQERTVIIAVVPANVDMHNTEILQAAQEADPNGTRTIAVVTKVDLVDCWGGVGSARVVAQQEEAYASGLPRSQMPQSARVDESTSIEKGVVNE
ncbi:Interferon-induced GTP-binding protein Mx1 [Phytophthora ramorum]|uniref:Interferon-induced GTP-binding protein Mx1 n=1 Tax=Phytophthora ramorum TaxID=164328 RepID=UPI0030A07C76|nr:Interferon-induced GTP-binding protein Mx1 [Phytophthora ramorum]